MAAAAMNQRPKTTSGEYPVAVAKRAPQPTAHTPPVVEFNLYNNDKLDDAVSHANEITSTYRVEIISMNIISAIPGDKKLQVRFHFLYLLQKVRLSVFISNQAIAHPFAGEPGCRSGCCCQSANNGDHG